MRGLRNDLIGLGVISIVLALLLTGFNVTLLGSSDWRVLFGIGLGNLLSAYAAHKAMRQGVEA